MRTAEFLEAYPRDLTPSQIHHGVTIPEVQAAQLYSYAFGQLAFDALSNKREGLTERRAQLTAYEDQVDFAVIEDALVESPNGWDYRNEVNFYGLNFHMEKMWTPLVMGEWPKDADHKHSGNFSMNGLALEGLRYYIQRERFIAKHGIDTYDGADLSPIVRRNTGFMQEFDATIAVLNWAKKYSNLTVVPAPAQFEHNAQRANIDLLVVDFREERTVGVQVKTVADQKTRSRYDPDRVVIIDSSDLSNVRLVGGSKASHSALPRPWPGLIAASRVGAIQTRRNTDIAPQFIPYLLRKKMEAAVALGKYRIDYNEVSATIGKKILEKL